MIGLDLQTLALPWGVAVVTELTEVVQLFPSPLFWPWPKLTLNVTLNMNLTLTDQDPDNPPYRQRCFFLNSYENVRRQRNNSSRVIWWVRPREQDELWCNCGQFAIAVRSTKIYITFTIIILFDTVVNVTRLSALEEGTGVDYQYNNYEHAAAAASTRNTDVVSYGTWRSSLG